MLMKVKKKCMICLMSIMAISLTACGPSEEKLSEVQVALQAMDNARSIAQDTYGDLIDSSYGEQLETLVSASEKFDELEYEKMNDTKIDEVLPSINELTASFEALESSLLEISEKEKQEAELEGRYVDVQGYIVNKTGQTITSIILRDEAEDTDSDNMIIDGVELGSGEILMGIVFEVYVPTDKWSIVITTAEGNSYTAEVEGLDEADLFGMTFEGLSEDGSFSATLTEYIKEESSEVESAADAVSSASSENETEDTSSADEASSESSN